MRAFVIFLVIAGLGYLFLRQKQNDAASVVEKPAVAQSATAKTIVVAKASTPAPLLTPAPRGQASEYNYMKRALDRAADVRDQARSRTNDAQDIHP